MLRIDKIKNPFITNEEVDDIIEQEREREDILDYLFDEKGYYDNILIWNE